MTDWSELDSYLDAHVDDRDAAGFTAASLVVVRRGGVVHRHHCGDALRYLAQEGPGGALGRAVELPVGARVPVTADTLFDMASNTKMWATNLALMILVGRGAMSLERPVCDFPGWGPFAEGGRRTVTVADLLRHEAGLVADPHYFDPRWVGIRRPGDLYCSGTPAHPVGRRRIIDAICRTPSARPAHTGYCYSDLDYMILGLLVEQLTGRRLDAFLENGLYSGLELAATVFNPLAKGFDADRIAATEPQGNTRGGSVSLGPAPDGTPAPLRRATLRGQVHDEKAWYCMAGVSGHAGLFTDASDLAVLLRMGLGEGELAGRRYIDADVWRQFARPQGATARERAESTHGLGWRVAPAAGPGYPPFGPAPAPGSIGHTGWTGTLTVVDAASDLAIGLMTGARHRLGADVGRAGPVDYGHVVSMVYRAAS